MLKIEKEYEKRYGEISKNSSERIMSLESSFRKNDHNILIDEIKRIKNIKWKRKTFVIYILPKATPRPRLGVNGTFYVKGAQNNKKIFEKYLLNQNVNMIYTPTKFCCKSYFPIPKGMSRIEKVLAEMGLIRPISKPDWDNVGKSYCDMIQGFLIYDDSLIIEGSSKKYYSTKPRIEITISYMEDFDSQFNKKKMLKRKGEK